MIERWFDKVLIMEFLTEKQIETYLEMETRSLAMPEGGHQIVRANNLCWSIYDGIINLKDYTSEEIIGLTRRHMSVAKISFEEAFINLIGHIKRTEY